MRKLHRAFTLVELLVVIAIIGILVALLLPAIQAARAAARRTQCQSQIKQVGLALHNYHTTNNIFPPGMQTAPLPAARAANNIRHRPNWIMYILPYLEEQALYDSFHPDTWDLKKTVTVSPNPSPLSDVNRIPRGTQIPTLLCPEDATNANVPFKGNHPQEGDNWARGNYACNGDNERTDVGITKDPARIGVIRVNKSLKIAQILDGTTHTILAAEIRIGVSEIDRRGVWALGHSGSSNLTWHGFSGDCNGPNTANARSDDIMGCRDLINSLGGLNFNGDGNSVLQQERMSCWNDCDSFQACPRSRHAPGGVHVVMCDGAVRWISDNIQTSGEFGPYEIGNIKGAVAIWDRLISSQDGVPVVELE